MNNLLSIERRLKLGKLLHLRYWFLICKAKAGGDRDVSIANV